MGALTLQVLPSPKGVCVCVEIQACAMDSDPMQAFPAWLCLQFLRGVGQLPAMTSGDAQTSPPEGMLRSILRKKYRRAVGKHYRLTHIRPDTAHAIGWTVELALRYSIISSSTAGPSHYGGDYGTDGATGAGATPPHPQGP